MALPEKIRNAPELLPGLDFFFSAFTDLQSCRSLGFSEGPVPWTAIKLYCDEHGIAGDQRSDMFYHIVRMDTVYLEYRNAKAKAKDTTGKPGKRPAK